VSVLSVPPFDVLSGASEPFTGLGSPLPESPERLQTLRSVANDAKNRVEKGFGLKLDDGNTVAHQLDIIISQMWADGWSPRKGNVDLFVTDSG